MQASVEEQRAALNVLEDLEVRKAQLHAEAVAVRAEIAQLWSGTRSGFAEMEVAGTAHVGQFRAARELEDAQRQVELFPHLHALLAEGLVFVPTVEAVLRGTRRCTPEVQAAVDARLAGQVVGVNVTDVRRILDRTILAVEAEIDAKLTQQRLDQAKKDARVWSSRGDDGMTSIGAIIDAVAGRRWTLDFEQLVKAQVLLDKREGRERTVEEVKVEVFSHLPSLVLELIRAARDGRLTDYADLSEIDPEAAADLERLADETRDLPLPQDVEPSEPTPAPVVDEDPYDGSTVDPYADVPLATSEPPADDPPEPGPPPWDRAAQDAAFWRTAQPAAPPDPHLQVLMLRCLQMPLQKPTTVNLHIPMATALDLTNAPGVLEGHGPLDATRIRQLIPDARLAEVYVDAVTGVPLGMKRPEPPEPGQHLTERLARRLRAVTLMDEVEPQHDPSAALAAFVKLRDQICCGPGCTMPATRCDLDHELEFPDGPTAEWNLGDKSRRCHCAKHHGWTCTRHADGTTEWVSPTGRVYVSLGAWAPPPAFEQPPFQVYLPPTEWVVEIELDQHPA